jgi:hypothetical protein
MSTKVKYHMNNISAEWLRLWSVRSSWFFAICNIVGVTGVSFLAGSELGSSAPAGASPWNVAGFIGLPALFGCLVLFSIASTADYATKNIIPTLQWTPQRSTVLIARALLMTSTATLFGVMLVGLATAVLWMSAPQLQLFSGQDLEKVGHVAFVYAASILLTIGLALLTRNTAATLASVFGLILVLPILLQIVPFQWATTIIELLPGTGVLYFLIGEGPGDTDLDTTYATLTLLIWSVGVFLFGAWRFLKDDANR